MPSPCADSRSLIKRKVKGQVQGNSQACDHAIILPVPNIGAHVLLVIQVLILWCIITKVLAYVHSLTPPPKYIGIPLFSSTGCGS